jgi:glyoxylate/hydroxypyruvate reductase A
MQASANAIVVATTEWAPEEWVAAARAADPRRPVFTWPEVPDMGSVGYALVWKPPEGSLAALPNLKLIFSLGAGVDHVVFQDRLPDVPIVRVASSDLSDRMTEWVTLQVLAVLRRQREYAALQAESRWHEILPQPAARSVRAGVMGMGVIGSRAADMLVRLGFQVAGWSRRRAHVAGVESFAGTGELDPFLARTDILVVLLPLTHETRGILAAPLFRKLARDGALGAPVLINAGRGGLQVEEDILKALDDGILGGATLDVFETEPLPSDSRLWVHPKVTVTPHAAAWSSPRKLVPEMLAQIAAFERGEPLSHVVDRGAGY